MNRTMSEKGSNMNILLDDLLSFSNEMKERTKVRFQQANEQYGDPMQLYLENPEIVNTEWLLHRTANKVFKVGQIVISLLKLSKDNFLLTTVKEIIEDLDVKNGVNYEGKELEEYRKFYGRVIINYHKDYQTNVRSYQDILGSLVVNQILPDRFDGDDFPGYDQVQLSWKQLETIVKNNKKDWISALKGQKAVYLITDKNNGKLYVGSATGENGMLFQRWQSYVANGHGGNVELKALIEREGFEYVKQNFQYAILENYNSKVDDKVILTRESWWKETLQSRRFGYNSN